jgi:hypothetical protein
MALLDSRSPDEIIGYDENGLPRSRRSAAIVAIAQATKA